MIDYLSPVIGALIGLFTNWLAIKMLFLPRNPIYIGKYRLPMTPGLIYKEQGRIAGKMASVTTKYIFTKSTIEENIKSEKNISLITDIINENKESDLRTLLGDNYESVKKVILLNTINYLKKESTINIFVERLSSTDIPSKFFSLKKWLIEEGNGIKIQSELIEKYKDRKISEFIPDDKNFIIEKAVEKISLKLNDFLMTNEKADEVLRKLTHRIISENVGKIAGLFLNGDKIYESIKNNFSEYLLSENGQKEILSFILQLKEKSAGELLTVLKGDESIIISEKTMSDIISELESLDYFQDKSFDEKIKSLIISLYLKNIDKIAEKAFELLMKIKFLKIFDLNPVFLDFSINYLLDKLCLVIFNNINIEAIVESRINSFDIELLEKVVLSIVKKELNLITVTGGILGFIIGAVPLICRLVS